MQNLVDSASDWRADLAIQLSHDALQPAKDDKQLREQIFNNPCYYYCQYDPMQHQREIAENLRALEAELRPEKPEKWPINFVDTALFARCRLRTERLELMRVLEAALDARIVRPWNESDVREHVREARDILPRGVIDAPARSRW